MTMLRFMLPRKFYLCLFFVGIMLIESAPYVRAFPLTIDVKHLTSLKNFINYRDSVFRNTDSIKLISSLQIASRGGGAAQIDWRFLSHFSKTNLKQLYLQGLALTELPKQISGLHGLTLLNAENNRLRTLPMWLKNLVNLKALYLENNQLTGLPRFNQIFQNMEELDVAHNRLRSLGQQFGQIFPRLKHLTLGHNQLKNLPDSLYMLRSLEWLDLSFNQIKDIKPSIRRLASLQDLNLAGNQIRLLPTEISTLRDRIVSIDLSGNPLVQSSPQNNRLGLDQLRAVFVPEILVLGAPSRQGS